MKRKNYIKTSTRFLTCNSAGQISEKPPCFKLQYGLAVLLFVVMQATGLYGQEQRVSGEATTLENDLQKTKRQYEIETLEMARQNALDKAFGSSVESRYERLNITEMEGRSVSANREIRNNYISTFPNGRWIKDISKSTVETQDENGNWWMTCTVTGYARKIESAEVRFTAYTLDGSDPQKDIEDSFTEGEEGYLYFRSPEEGNVIVFYDDFKTVQRCVPYNVSSENYIRVKANNDYIFFSGGENDYLPDKTKMNGIEFYTELPRDYNLFYVLYSPVPFTGYDVNNPDSLSAGYTTFHWMDRNDFQDWLQEQRVRNKDLQLKIIGVTITEKL